MFDWKADLTGTGISSLKCDIRVDLELHKSFDYRYGYRGVLRLHPFLALS